MAYCAKCGSNLPSGASFCSSCGASNPANRSETHNQGIPEKVFTWIGKGVGTVLLVPVAIILFMAGTIGPKATWWEVGGWVQDKNIPIPSIVLPDRTCRDFHRWSPKVESELNILMIRTEELPEYNQMSLQDAKELVTIADEFLNELDTITPGAEIEDVHLKTIEIFTLVRDLAQARVDGDRSDSTAIRTQFFRSFSEWQVMMIDLEEECS